MLKVDGLHANLGAAHVLRGVSLEVAAGEAVALLGRNGAGKTTTLRAIMGLVPPSAGVMRFGDQRIDGLPPYRIARLGIGYVPEDRRVFTELTVRENLEVGARAPATDTPAWTEQRLFALFPNLGRMVDRPGGRMSGGEQQMLTLARTLMSNPTLLLLDEPSEGLAPVIVEQMSETIASLKRQGLTLLLSEQNLRFAGEVCDRAYVIERGEIRHTDAMAALLNDETVRRRYLVP